MIVGVLLLLVIMAVIWGAGMMFGPGHTSDEEEWMEDEEE